ncbi:hypothetical protein D3C72_2225010 [compost metagenome]
MGNGPTRLTGAETQLALIGQVIDLEHHAVDLIRQGIALFADGAVISQTLLHALGQFQLGADRQAPALERLEDADMAVRQLALHLADAVAA